ncbi:hypothetical protein ACTJJB_27660 [Chitinophaga sp. 22536]|uniref:hypothetical protein n=1 Tax=unclassified Chitinophaga TaxID=2619133 RepID=UPI003F843F98
MKKIIIPVLAAASFLNCSQLSAQQKKNFISAGFSVSNKKKQYDLGSGITGKTTNNTYTGIAAYGHYFRERWAVGVQAWYVNTASSPMNEAETKSSKVNFGPFIRYEQPIWSNRLSVYADGAFNAGLGKAQASGLPGTDNYHPERNSSSFQLSIVPGLMFHLTPSFSLTANMGNFFLASTQTDKVKGTSEKTTMTDVGMFKDFGFNSVVFGINFHF